MRLALLPGKRTRIALPILGKRRGDSAENKGNTQDIVAKMLW